MEHCHKKFYLQVAYHKGLSQLGFSSLLKSATYRRTVRPANQFCALTMHNLLRLLGLLCNSIWVLRIKRWSDRNNISLNIRKCSQRDFGSSDKTFFFSGNEVKREIVEKISFSLSLMTSSGLFFSNRLAGKQSVFSSCWKKVLPCIQWQLSSTSSYHSLIPS